jgi:hypothetical protein
MRGWRQSIIVLADLTHATQRASSVERPREPQSAARIVARAWRDPPQPSRSGCLPRGLENRFGRFRPTRVQIPPLRFSISGRPSPLTRSTAGGRRSRAWPGGSRASSCKSTRAGGGSRGKPGFPLLSEGAAVEAAREGIAELKRLRGALPGAGGSGGGKRKGHHGDSKFGPLDWRGPPVNAQSRLSVTRGRDRCGAFGPKTSRRRSG